jgi:GNAT superfamily N-acetyltransferase
MEFGFTSVPDFGLAPTAELLTRAFADYFVPLPVTPAILLHLARADSVDLATSLVMTRGTTPIAVALIARRGWTNRIAAMALIPEARRQGAGRALVERCLSDAKARGDRVMVLEVIEANEPAVQLYLRCGFTRVRRLVGFAAKPESVAPGADAGLVEVDVRAMAAVATSEAAPNLPWQLSGESLAQLAPPAVAYRLGGAWIALSNPSAEQIVIRGLVTVRTERGHGRSAALLRAVMARYPGKEWSIKPVWPEEFSDAFTAVGFRRTELSQWQMTRDIV